MRTKQNTLWETSASAFVDTGYTSSPSTSSESLDYAGSQHSQQPLYTATPWTSAPSTTQCRLPSPSSSPYPSSPPPLNHARSPYATVDLPSQLPNEEGDPIVHPVLERGSTLLAMHWDVRTPPLAALTSVNFLLRHRQQSQDRRETGSTLNWQYQAATFPALDSIVIRTTALGDRPLVVFPAGSRHHYVTVLDVLDAVHRAIRLEHFVEDDARSPALFGGRAGRKMGACLDARDRRRSRSMRAETDAGPGVAHSHGWLWGGLTPSPTEKDVWILLLH